MGWVRIGLDGGGEVAGALGQGVVGILNSS